MIIVRAQQGNIYIGRLSEVSEMSPYGDYIGVFIKVFIFPERSMLLIKVKRLNHQNECILQDLFV